MIELTIQEAKDMMAVIGQLQGNIAFQPMAFIQNKIIEAEAKEKAIKNSNPIKDNN